MKVKCIADKLEPGIHSHGLIIWANNSQLEVTKGKTYVVLAITKLYGTIFYFILGDESKNYPLSFPSCLFEVVDPKTSKYWDTNIHDIGNLDKIDILEREIISFKEWRVGQDIFYENVLEESKAEMSIFAHFRDKILEE